MLGHQELLLILIISAKVKHFDPYLTKTLNIHWIFLQMLDKIIFFFLNHSFRIYFFPLSNPITRRWSTLCLWLCAVCSTIHTSTIPFHHIPQSIPQTTIFQFTESPRGAPIKVHRLNSVTLIANKKKFSIGPSEVGNSTGQHMKNRESFCLCLLFFADLILLE